MGPSSYSAFQNEISFPESSSDGAHVDEVQERHMGSDSELSSISCHSDSEHDELVEHSKHCNSSQSSESQICGN